MSSSWDAPLKYNNSSGSLETFLAIEWQMSLAICIDLVPFTNIKTIYGIPALPYPHAEGSSIKTNSRVALGSTTEHPNPPGTITLPL